MQKHWSALYVDRALQSFNSRTCQVVLGAGAMRSAGLKNITAKHLGECNAIGVIVMTAE